MATERLSQGLKRVDTQEKNQEIDETVDEKTD